MRAIAWMTFVITLAFGAYSYPQQSFDAAARNLVTEDVSQELALKTHSQALNVEPFGPFAPLKRAMIDSQSRGPASSTVNGFQLRQ